MHPTATSHKDYFEGILQLRGAYEQALHWVINKTKEDARANINKTKKVQGGYDLYFDNRRYLVAIAKKLKQTFTGELKTTATLHTHKRGDDLYRVTVLFRVMPVKIGEIYFLQGEEIQLVKVDSKAHIKNLKTGHRKTVNLETLNRAITHAPSDTAEQALRD